MSNVKLHINITQGIIDAEGDQEFVWRVYEDFRDRLDVNLFTRAGASPPTQDMNLDTEETEQGSDEASSNERPKKRQKRRPSQATAASGGKEKSAGAVTTHKPRLLHDLDTTGVKEFLSAYRLTNHTDTIVALAKFLQTKGVSPASLDAFFTCYSDAGLKVPEAFGQAFVRTRGDKGFINFSSVDDVELTLRGRNHIDHGGIKKANE